MLRDIMQEDSGLARTAKKHMSKGELVPDNIVIEVLKQRLSEGDCGKGFILDGFPRTLDQAKALDQVTRIDAIVNLSVPERIIVKRLTSRRICKECGEIYNILYLKPKKEGACDKCGGELYQRADDTPKVVKDRLKIYEDQTRPIIEYYRGRVPMVGFRCKRLNMPPEEAIEEILEKLGKLKLQWKRPSPTHRNP